MGRLYPCTSKPAIFGPELPIVYFGWGKGVDLALAKISGRMSDVFTSAIIQHILHYLKTGC
uniref:Uncharacterized protein n=1 Tax=Arundo donax TaxID=35708 RepID=A0A0A9BQQ4_ARUDO